MSKSILTAGLLGLAIFAFSVNQTQADEEAEAPFDPSLPHFEIKVVETDDGPETRITKHDEEEALSDKDLKARLLKIGNHAENESGWKGRAPDTGISENPVVVHVSALADATRLEEFLAVVADAKVYRFVVGVTEYTQETLAGTAAPDLDELPAGYTKHELPIDEGNGFPLPKERITITADWDAEASKGTFSIALSIRDETEIAQSELTSLDLTNDDASKRKKVREGIKKAASELINKPGLKIEVCEISAVADAKTMQSAPWAMVDLIGNALRELNDERDRDGLQTLEIEYPWNREVAPPPPPLPPPPAQPENDGETGQESSDPRPRREPGPIGPRKSQDDPPEPVGDQGRARRAKLAQGIRIKAALDWLRDHQNPEGFWSATDFDEDTKRDSDATRNIEFIRPNEAAGDEGWKDTLDIGLTGLALLAFARAGEHHLHGEYRTACRKAVVYLRKVQSKDGCFGGKEHDHFVYDHAIATTAMAEIYDVSGDSILKPHVERAVDFILKAQNPGLGWRYGVQPGVNDSSVTGVMVQALVSAREAGVDFDEESSFDGAANWFELVTVEHDGGYKTGYNKPGSPNARLRNADQYTNNGTMEAIYIKSMLTMGKADADDEAVAAMAEALVEEDALPVWEHYDIDLYYWYFASRALSEVGGDGLKKWEESTIEVLHDHQRGWHTIDKVSNHTSPDKLDEHGSWDPVGTWGSAGGRVYATAMGALTLLALE